MTTPINESIMLNVEALINTITIANGYNQDLTALRSKRVDYQFSPPENGVTLITWNGDTEKDDTNFTDTWIMEISIFSIVAPSAESDDIDPLFAQVSADIDKALKIDTQRNSLAMDTRVISKQPQDSTIGEGINIIVEIDYRTDVGDPYNFT